MNLLNNYYTDDELKKLNNLNYIPSINDDLIIDLSLDKFQNMDYSFELKTVNEIPSIFSSIYTKKSAELNQNYYNFRKKIGEIRKTNDRIHIPLYDIYYLIKPIAVNLNIPRFNWVARKYFGKIEYKQKGYIWDLINLESNERLTKYAGNIGHGFYIYFKFKLLPNKPLKSLFIFNNLNTSPFESYITYRDQYFKDNLKDHKDLYIFSLDSSNSDLKTDDKYFNFLKDKFFFNYYFIDKSICDKDIITTKYDYIDVSNILYNFKLRDNNYNELNNSQIFFNYVRLILKILNINGSATISIYDTYSELNCEILYILRKFFKNVYLTKIKIGPVLRPYNKIILKSFIGISSKEIKELDKISREWYKISKCYNFNLDQKKYVSNILKFKEKPNIFYNHLNLYNLTDKSKKLMIITIIYNHYINLINLNYEDYKKKIEVLAAYQRISSYKYLRSVKININETVIKKSINDIIYDDMFDYINYKNYTFNNDYEINDININNLNDKLMESRTKYIFTKKMIDYLNFDKWANITSKTRIFKGILPKMVKELTLIKVSQAFLKMYEILTVYPIFDKNNTEVNTFSICEAPGQFINAINHYLKTKTNNKIFNWYANSLNHKSEINIKKYGKNIISDTYGLIKKYPNKWLYGKDNTGDITNIDNIYYFKDKIKDKNIDLITSDCGLSFDDFRTYNYTEEKISFINFNQILVILFCLPIGKSFILKTFLPQIQAANISLNNILYNLFEKLHFYKPVQNKESGEFYIIGLNYKGITDILKQKLINFHKNYKYDEYIIPIDKLFLFLYEKYITKLIDNCSYAIEKKTIYYNNEQIFNNYIVKINKTKIKNCKLWVKKFGILKINKNSLL